MNHKNRILYPLLLFCMLLSLLPANPEAGKTKKVDAFSYNLGVIGAFSEVVSLGIKKLALSAPLSAGEMKHTLPEAKKIALRNDVQIYLENDFLVTDLFAANITRNKQVLLIYRGDTLKQYLALKSRKIKMVERGAYQGEARRALAREMGRLLSYPRATIERMLTAAKTDTN